MFKSKMTIFGITLLLALPVSATDMALAHHFNFDGQLLDSNGDPVSGPVAVTFEIYNPAKSCLLYKEDHSVSPDAAGHFSVKIGTGARDTATDGNHPWDKIFSNSVVFAIGANCSSWTPATTDGRALQVSVAGTALAPDYELSAVPMATVAETLQGYKPSGFIKTNEDSLITDSQLQLNDGSALRFNDTSAGYVGLKSPTTGDNTIYTLPATDGTANDVLQTDGSGILSWVTPAGGGNFMADGSVPMTGSMNMNSAGKIINLLDPTNPQDGATKSYVDTALGGITIGTAEITDNTITASDIAASAVDTSELADGSVTDIKVVDVSVGKLVNAAGVYFNYKPNNAACADGDILEWDNTNNRWECAIDDNSTNTIMIQGRPVSANTPANTQALIWDGAQWIPSDQGVPYLNHNAGVAVSLSDTNETLGVGMGGPSTSARLHVVNVGGDTKTYGILAQDSGGNTAIRAMSNTGTAIFTDTTNAAGKAAEFRVNAVTKVVITNNGMGINKTTPTAALDVNGKVYISDIIKLPVQPVQPACGGPNDGDVALTNGYILCVCNGSAWVKVSDGVSGCTF